MARSRFPTDVGLSSRMLLTMFLLALLYVVFVAVLIALRIPAVLVVPIPLGLLLFQYFFSDRIALLARRCALAAMPKPRVALAESDIPNAFATGRNPKVAVVCATTGIMRKLSKPELEAVLAHELSHVAHRDVAVMTIASFLGLLAGFVVRMAIYGGFYGGGYGSHDDDDDSSTGAVILLVVIASAVVYGLSFLLTRALSRYRELSADRAGAMLLGRPSLLASAMTKVSGDMARIPTRDLRAAEPLNAFFFAPALAPGFSLSSLFATHPSLERRLEQLSRIEAELGRQA